MAIAISEAVLNEVFITWEDYKNSTEKLFTYSEAAEILGVTIAAIKSQKNKKPEKYVWGEFWKYIQQPASSKNEEVQTMVGITKAGLLELSMDLTETPQIRLFKDFMRRSALRDPDFIGLSLTEFVQKQKTILEKEKAKREPFVESQSEARCLHESCKALLKNRESIARGMGWLCYSGKCKCNNTNLRQKKAKK